MAAGRSAGGTKAVNITERATDCQTEANRERTDVKFAEDKADQRFAIHAYDSGEVTVSGPEGVGLRVLTESFVIGREVLVPNWGPREVVEVTPGHLEAVLEQGPEVVLLGSGDRLRFPEPAVQRLLIEHGIGLETMDTAAACRTFNILAGEGRLVVAALIL